MARLIEPTPILSGQDAEDFYRSIEDFEYDASKEQMIENARRLYNELKSNWSPFSSHVSEKK